ncbi:MAG: sugar phosphate isomerase/epimerase [Armatimonadetes bacterium]|nr:sugar phosphate isomerase/epimerase [Armatimonadota bacterium]
MDIQLGIWNLNWSHFTFEEALAGIRATGFTDVALYPQHSDGPCYTEAMSEDAITALKQRLDDCGLRCVMLMAVSPVTSGADAAKRRIDMASVMRVDMLCATGTWEWLEFLKQRKPDEQLAAEHRAYVDAWQEVAPYAEQSGVTIALKPHGGNSATGPLLRQTIDDVGSPAFQACVDAGNVRFYEGIDPVADVDPILPHARMMCLKDHSGPRGHGDFPIIGDGGVDHPALFAKLHAAGFSGPAVIERYDGASGRTGIDFYTVCERARISRANVLRIAASIG